MGNVIETQGFGLLVPFWQGVGGAFDWVLLY